MKSGVQTRSDAARIALNVDAALFGARMLTFGRFYGSSSIDEPIPIEDLLVLEGRLDGHRVRILKDDGSNAIFVPLQFFRVNREN